MKATIDLISPPDQKKKRKYWEQAGFTTFGIVDDENIGLHVAAYRDGNYHRWVAYEWSMRIGDETQEIIGAPKTARHNPNAVVVPVGPITQVLDIEYEKELKNQAVVVVADIAARIRVLEGGR